ncbi:MAG: SDR family oxidoreductase [Methylococcaceae bacterium]|jgi:NADP-dependent 3-hydroxy acid dehydrogenase YdfG
MSCIKRTALITGASSGIGRAIARLLLQQGHQVIGLSRDISQFVKPMPGFTAIQVELGNLTTLPAQLEAIKKNFPALDTLILAAGYGQFGMLEQFSYGQIELLFSVNFTSQAFIARALLPLLKRNSHSDVIFMGSEAALKGSRKGAIYCASKFAIRGFAQALREECSKSGVRVCLINPGMVKTEFFEQLDFAPGEDPSNFLLPEEVAQAIDYVLKSSPSMTIDELNLNPLNKVIRFKKPEP